MVASAQEGKRRKQKFMNKDAEDKHEKALDDLIKSKNYTRAMTDDEEGKGKPALIRLWDYSRARCITMMIMPVIEMQCMSFSHDGRYLACVGLDHMNKELIIVWDISRVQRGDKPEIVAK
jgi:hypothetical protein